MRLALEQANDRAEKAESTAVLALVLLASGALLFSLAIMGYSLHALKPLRQLREGVRRISEGEYAERVRIRTRDEVGQLASWLIHQSKD